MQQLFAGSLVTNGAVAAIERAIQLTADYIRERNTFGNAIFDYQNTQFKLAECSRLDGGTCHGGRADTAIIAW